MFSDLKSPGDGLSSSTDRLYPALDDLSAFTGREHWSDEEGEDSAETGSISGTSEARSTPPLPNHRRYLYPKKEFVDHLTPEEIRWFYREEGSKKAKWTPFIGYDSLRIECKHRALAVESQDGSHDLGDHGPDDVILVRGGLYQVDVGAKKCTPVYWSGDEYEIMQGTWFYGGSWQPVEEGYARQIETEHLVHFIGLRLDEELPPASSKGPPPVIHKIMFQNFYVDWNSSSHIYMFSESTSSKLMRSVSNKLGLRKSGHQLHRGYCNEAFMDDKPADVSHLVFVIHGIGQKMESGNIVKRCNDLRTCVGYVQNKHFPDLDSTNQRAEFLPVEWRSSLKLDGDTVESITPNKLRGIRTILNSSAMDILYYTSPLYRSEITHSLQSELNRLYTMFCERHPYFEASGGKVSVVAHSLGVVITYDIITGWNPIELYDQYVSSVIEDERMQAAGSSELLAELDKAKSRVQELETLLKSVHEIQSQATPTLKFQIENFFCLGSPMAVFLALRGIRPQGNGALDHILPSSMCRRLFNVYHPADPVAYRLEPLILKHYSTVMPLHIHHHDAPKKMPYTKIKSKAYAAFHGSTEMLNEKTNQSKKTSPDTTDSTTGSAKLPEAKTAKTSRFGGWLSGFATLRKKGDDSLSAELKMLRKMEKDAEDIEKLQATEKLSTENIDSTDLEYRLDYQLKESSFESSYISVLTAHTSYWTNKDIACFILTHLVPSLQTM